MKDAGYAPKALNQYGEPVEIAKDELSGHTNFVFYPNT
jgi:hypothetical protein